MYSFCRGYFVPAMPTFAIVKSARATVPWSYCTPVANLGDVSDDTTVDVDVGGWWVNVKRCAIVFNSSLVILTIPITSPEIESGRCRTALGGTPLS